MKQLITLSALSLLALIGTPASAQSMDKPLAPSAASAYPVAPAPGLYDALGGQTGLRALMNDFVNRLKADARLAEAFKEANGANLAKQLTDQLGAADAKLAGDLNRLAEANIPVDIRFEQGLDVLGLAKP